MNLQQYLDQVEPVRMPTVRLKKEELVILQTCRVLGRERHLVAINNDHPLLRDAYYCLVDGQLWVMDGDGNPRVRSCFQLE